MGKISPKLSIVWSFSALDILSISNVIIFTTYTNSVFNSSHFQSSAFNWAHFSLVGAYICGKYKYVPRYARDIPPIGRDLLYFPNINLCKLIPTKLTCPPFNCWLSRSLMCLYCTHVNTQDSVDFCLISFSLFPEPIKQIRVKPK